MAGLCPVFPEANITIRNRDPIPAPFLLGCHEPALEMVLLCPCGAAQQTEECQGIGASSVGKGEAKGTVSFTHHRCHRQHLVATPGLEAQARRISLPGEEASPQFNHFPKSLHVASLPAALFHCSPAPAAADLH